MDSIDEESAALPAGKLQKEKKVFTCAECNLTYSRLEYLKRHERKHQDVRPFSCSECDKTFARSDVLLRHKRKQHPELEEETPLSASQASQIAAAANASANSTNNTSVSSKQSRKSASNPYPHPTTANKDNINGSTLARPSIPAKQMSTATASSSSSSSYGGSASPMDSFSAPPPPAPSSSSTSLSSQSQEQRQNSQLPQAYSQFVGIDFPMSLLAQNIPASPGSLLAMAYNTTNTVAQSPPESSVTSLTSSAAHQQQHPSSMPFTSFTFGGGSSTASSTDWAHGLFNGIDATTSGATNVMPSLDAADNIDSTVISPPSPTFSALMDELSQSFNYDPSFSTLSRTPTMNIQEHLSSLPAEQRESAYEEINDLAVEKEKVMLRSEYSDWKAKAFGSLGYYELPNGSNDAFWIPANRFAGCYSVSHWGLPDLNTMTKIARRSVKELDPHMGSLIHAPTFKLSEIPGCLAFSICTVGGPKRGKFFTKDEIWSQNGLESGAGDTWDGLKSIVRYEKVDMLVKSFSRSRGNLWTDYNIGVLQALIMYNGPAFLSDSQTQRGMAHASLGSIIHIARRVGIFDPKNGHADVISPVNAFAWLESSNSPNNTTSEALEQAWKAFIKAESARRTAFMVYVMDSISSLESGTPPLLLPEDVAPFPLPAPDIIWLAPTAVDWAREVLAWNGSMTLHDTMTLNYKESMGAEAVDLCVTWRLQLGPFARLVLILSVLRNILNLGEGKGGWMDCWLRGIGGSAMSEVEIASLYKKALQKWRKCWDFDPACTPESLLPPPLMVCEELDGYNNSSENTSPSEDSNTASSSSLSTMESPSFLFKKDAPSTNSIEVFASKLDKASNSFNPSWQDHLTLNGDVPVQEPWVASQAFEEMMKQHQEAQAAASSSRGKNAKEERQPYADVKFCHEALPYYWFSNILLEGLMSSIPTEGRIKYFKELDVDFATMLNSAKQFSRMGEGKGAF